MSEIHGEEFGTPDRGICPKCGEWNCSEHAAEYSDLGHNPMAHLTEAQQERLKEYIRTMNAINAAMTDERLKELEDGKILIYNTGKETEFEEVEKDADGDDWKLPEPPMARRPMEGKIGINGVKVTYSDYIDTTVGGEAASVGWLTLLKKEDVVNQNGVAKTVCVFRPKPNAARLTTAYARATAVVPRLRRQLMLALEAEARVARERQKKSGKIDAGRASALVTEGKTDIFAKKASRKTITTAVSIVIDDSSSMWGSSYSEGLSSTGADSAGDELLRSKNGTSMVLAAALGEVCQKLGIPFEILSYQAGADFCEGSYAILYKTFNEPWATTKSRLGNYRCGASVDLPYEAATFAASRLAQRKEDRRILFFLTDGSDSNEGVKELGKLAQTLRDKINIRMVGVGIQDQCLKRHMDGDAEIVTRHEELTDAVFGRLAKIIHPK